jgi:photosystem II stability/assembly factor-like uncharacterized protein
VAIRSLASNSNGDVFAATAPCPGAGIFRTSDKGNNWISVHPRICVRVLAVNPDGDIFAISGEAILRSTDNGESWALLQGLGPNEFRAIAFQTPRVIFVGSMFHDESMGGIQRSSDNGDSWVQISFPDTIGVYVLVTNSSGHLFAGTGYGVYRSEDYGDTWDQTNIGFRELGYGQNVSALVIHPVNGSIFAALDYDGVYRSSDNGDSWVLTGLTNPFIQSIVINSNGGIFAASGRIPSGDFPDKPAGVFYSQDNGRTWTQINEGLTNLNVLTLALDAEGYLYAGTYSYPNPSLADGVFRTMKSTVE